MLMSWEYLPHNQSAAPTHAAGIVPRTLSTPRGVAIAIPTTPTRNKDNDDFKLLEMCKSV